jgi:acetyl esterase/lipase
VVDTSPSGTVDRHPSFDLYRPDGADRPLPVVVIVPGPVPPAPTVRPRDWPVYQGYARLVAGHGVCAAVVDQPFHAVQHWPAAADDLVAVIDAVRACAEVADDRIAVWAFSGGGLLIGRWLAESPAWLRCLALTYPVLAAPAPDTPPQPAELVGPGRPLVLTTVGREIPERQATVDRFLARAQATGTAVQLIDVPDGQHGFDVLDHTEQSRRAVREAVDFVVGHLPD